MASTHDALVAQIKALPYVGKLISDKDIEILVTNLEKTVSDAAAKGAEERVAPITKKAIVASVVLASIPLAMMLFATRKPKYQDQ